MMEAHLGYNAYTSVTALDLQVPLVEENHNRKHRVYSSGLPRVAETRLLPGHRVLLNGMIILQ